MEQNKYFYSIGYMLPIFSTLKMAREFVSMMIETHNDMISFLNVDDKGHFYIECQLTCVFDDYPRNYVKYFPVDSSYKGSLVKDGLEL